MKTFLILALTCCFTFAHDAQAQSRKLRDATTPAEYPPAGYSAKNYVDSNGCIYIRAGYGDTISWIPRVDRSRNQVCGHKPTFDKATLKKQQTQTAAAKTQKQTQPSLIEKTRVAQDANAPSDVSAPLSISIGAPEAAPSSTAASTVVANTAATTATATATATATKPARSLAAVKPKAKPAIKVVRKTKPKKVAKPVVKEEAPASEPAPVCAGVSAVSQKYMQQSSRFEVRCGPQDEQYN